jgi:hypothetical protein
LFKFEKYFLFNCFSHNSVLPKRLANADEFFDITKLKQQSASLNPVINEGFICIDYIVLNVE